MKRWWFAGCLSLLAVFVVPAVASAHILKTDGHITTILHTEPDDDSLITGIPSKYTVFFNDDTGKFHLSQCDCTVAITEQQKLLTVQPLAVTSDGISSDNTFTFPKPGGYALVVSGMPKTSNSFQPFTITYALQVDAGQGKPQHFSALLWMGVGLIMTTIFVLGYVMNKRSES